MSRNGERHEFDEMTFADAGECDGEKGMENENAASFRFAHDIHKALQHNIFRKSWQSKNSVMRYMPRFSMCEGDFCAGQAGGECSRTCLFLPADGRSVQESEMRRIKCSEAQALNRCVSGGRPLELNGKFFWYVSTTACQMANAHTVRGQLTHGAVRTALAHFARCPSDR